MASSNGRRASLWMRTNTFTSATGETKRLQILDPDGGFVAKYRGQATLSKWAEDFLATNVEEAEARARSNLEPELKWTDYSPRRGVGPYREALLGSDFSHTR